MDYQLPSRRKFLFVDSTPTGRLNANAKAHITSETNRRKRLKLVKAHQRQASTRSALKDHEYVVSSSLGSQSEAGSFGKRAPAASTWPTGSASDPVLGPVMAKAPTLTSPLTMVERQLIDMDPFLTMPVNLDRSAKSLIAIISPMFRESSFCKRQWGETFITSFGLSLWYNNECKLFNMLESISAFVDTKRGRSLSQETLRWRSAGIRSLNTLIADPGTRYGNDVLMGITGLMHSQTVYDSDARLQMPVHSRGMAQLLKHRGGLEGLDLPPSIEGYISVVSITSSKAQIAHLDNIAPGRAGQIDVKDWMDEVDFAIHILRGLSRWPGCQTLWTNDFTKWQYHVLSKLVDPLNQSQNDVEESHQLFILCFLAFTKWEYREDRESWINCVQGLELCFRDLGDLCSLPNVSWLLMDTIDKQSKRKWLVFRMIRVLHRLPVQRRTRVKELFFALITGNMLATTLTLDDIADLRIDFMAGLHDSAKAAMENLI